jgi:hypothetical protein
MTALFDGPTSSVAERENTKIILSGYYHLSCEFESRHGEVYVMLNRVRI